MKYWGPLNSTGGINGNDSYVNGNPSIGVQGSIPSFHGFEQTLRELQNLVIDGGYTPDPTINGSQVAQSVQSGKVIYGVDTGSADAMVSTLTPNPGLYMTGLTVRILKTSSTNLTTTPTLSLNGMGAQFIRRRNGLPVAKGDLVPNGLYEFAYDGTQFRTMAFLASDMNDYILPPATIWVRIDGNDANDGMANNPQHALLTVQAAINMIVQRFIAAGRTITIQFGVAGTYTGTWKVPQTPGILTIMGDINNPSNYICQAGGSAADTAVFASTSASVFLRGFTMVNTGGVTNTLAAIGSAQLDIAYCNFRASTSMAAYAWIVSLPGSSIFIDGPILLDGTTGGINGSCLDAEGGNLYTQNATFTLTSTPPRFTYFARCVNNGQMNFYGTTFTGATGDSGTSKYWANLNSVIQTNGAGAGYLPGGLAGTPAPNTADPAAHGAWYV